MDGPRFDALSKRLAGPLARRSLVKGLGGGLVAGLLARAGGSVEAAPCHKPNARCGHGQAATCCIAPDICSAGGICQSSTLACPVGGDSSNPRYRCADSGGFPCDCATEEGTGNFVCFVSGTCADCTNPSTPCPNGQSCVEASGCPNGTSCVTPCS